MVTMSDGIDHSEEYNLFMNQLRDFHTLKGTTLQSEPVLGGKRLDLYRIFKNVMAAGGFEQVTKNRGWKHVGDVFNFPSTCTNSAYVLKGVYIRNLLGWEEEKVWGKKWTPPAELLGPNAHKTSTLAGKSYKRNSSRRSQPQSQSPVPPRSFTPIRPEPSPPSRAPLLLAQAPMLAPTPSPTTIHPPIQQFQPMEITDEPHTCTISELHHKSQPNHHVHFSEDSKMDCVTAKNFNDITKQRILMSLQSNNENDVEWGLNYAVTISFECPEKMRLDNTPALLSLLLSLVKPFLNNDQGGDDPIVEGSVSFQHILKVLHIFRNLSFLVTNARLLGTDLRIKQILTRCFMLSTTRRYLELARHGIDIFENLAPHVELSGPFDDYISCLTHLVYTQERYLLTGAIQILTSLTAVENNQVYLISCALTVFDRITSLLLVTDEELMGTALEYLYRYSTLSRDFAVTIMQTHSGANIGILVSLLATKHKYFCPRLIQDNDTSGDTLLPGTMYYTDQFVTHGHGSIPCLPNLSTYQQLDEPYRCLGWLKDRFEISSHSSVLSLDDMYLLYEMRFGQEKALKIKEFYTVLKIAFPEALPGMAPDSAPVTGPIFEGISVRGIQIKMSILQDGSETRCQWTDCSKAFTDEFLLQQHIVSDHVSAVTNDDTLGCMWTDCRESNQEFKDKTEMAWHLHTHFDHEQPVFPLVVQDHINVDNSDIKGVALVAAHLLLLLSENVDSHHYFIPYEAELAMIARRRPKLARFVDAMFSKFSVEHRAP